MSILDTIKPDDIILTGDRTTGQLHLGHYVGSLKNRVLLQDHCRQFLLLADARALTDNMGNYLKVRDNVLQVALDYLAVGIDPDKSTIFIQSLVPELSELASYYLNLVTVSRLERNPTIKDEIKQRGYERDIPAGFLTYPAAQAADITAFKATIVPVGADQIPMIEQTNEIVRRFNGSVDGEVLVEARALVPQSSARLPGIDGKSKMSKSLGNALPLSANPDQIRHAVKMMYTDPNHLHVSDPGQVEGNVVFTYLDAFEPDTELVADLKQRYQRGGLGDSVIKQQLEQRLQETTEPIRTRRELLARDPDAIMQILKNGTHKAREAAAQTLAQVKAAMGLNYY
ncbi:tryptophan--tRNA ligase [Paludibacterium denitrificans]|uniref:Tryptophan--tRNA ligase n=1 Tax=Paludibacterium denitrificans TaxID=2675226 RepID=A0A844GAJ5_9NEIS|nr:tryptophan--tRNA ligase [Paludibacterium denitrificans]MTD33476.1 tryptophan--tRNA ligase [Paludibacterium denitrificans]